MPAIKLLISGKVQGVFYRATAKKIADELGIRGWIRNTLNGDVEIVATGSTGQLQDFIQWCRKGPEKAEVRGLEEEPIVPEPDVKGFTVIRGSSQG